MKANKFLKSRSGIYGIRNTVNNKIYVGKTKCFYRRCHQYIYDFKNRGIGHINNYLYNAMKKDGIDNFELFPLQFCELKLMTSLELAWIIQLKTTSRNFGYNIRLDSDNGMITSPETSLKISKNLKKQWSEGVRNGHSQKLKNSWEHDDLRKKQQSELLKEIKTKFYYEVHFPSGEIEEVLYFRLSELGLKNAITSFYRKKSNDVMCKDHRVIRKIKK